jgi:hypothetical protein
MVRMAPRLGRRRAGRQACCGRQHPRWRQRFHSTRYQILGTAGVLGPHQGTVCRIVSHGESHTATTAWLGGHTFDDAPGR